MENNIEEYLINKSNYKDFIIECVRRRVKFGPPSFDNVDINKAINVAENVIVALLPSDKLYAISAPYLTATFLFNSESQAIDTIKDIMSERKIYLYDIRCEKNDKIYVRLLKG